VGQSLAKLLDSRAEDLYAKYGIKPRIVGVCDSGGSVTDPSGLDRGEINPSQEKNKECKGLQ